MAKHSRVNAVQSWHGLLLLRRPPGGEQTRYFKVPDDGPELWMADGVDERVQTGGRLTENPCRGHQMR